MGRIKVGFEYSAKEIGMTRKEMEATMNEVIDVFERRQVSMKACIIIIMMILRSVARLNPHLTVQEH